MLKLLQSVHDKVRPATKIDRAHIRNVHHGLAILGCCPWQAAWQRRTALGFFQAAASTVRAIRLHCCCEHCQAMGELLCCTSSPSVDADELRL